MKVIPSALLILALVAPQAALAGATWTGAVADAKSAGSVNWAVADGKVAGGYRLWSGAVADTKTAGSINWAVTDAKAAGLRTWGTATVDGKAPAAPAKSHGRAVIDLNAPKK
jgi:hypothetical protein